MPKQYPSDGWDCHVHVFDADAAIMPGHYRPVHRPLADIEALAQQHRFGHLVLVQPSVYGTDNRVLMQALEQGQGRHRGVAVVAPDITDSELHTLHGLGVRGVRFNLVSPVGNRKDTSLHFKALAPRLVDFGWHVQWYARPEDLPGIAALHATVGVKAVLDHLGGLQATTPLTHAAWQALQQLAGQGHWIKLSAWYRLGATAPYNTLDPTIARVAALFNQHMVWGSDWPHTSFFRPEALPAYEEMWAPVSRVLGATQQAHVRSAAPALLYA